MFGHVRPALVLSLGMVLLVACDSTQPPTEPAADALSADVTTEGLVSNTLLFKASCQRGVTGTIWLVYGGNNLSYDCSTGASYRFPVYGGAMSIYFENLNPAPTTDCSNVGVATDGLPFRYTCTVNGPNWNGQNHGKPLAKGELKFVKD